MGYTLKKNVLLVLFLLQLCAHAQQTAVAYYDSIVATSISSVEKQQTLEAMLLKSDTLNLETRAHLNYEFSKWLFRNRSRTLGKDYALKEFALRKQLGDTVLLKRNLFNLGYMHSRLEYPDYQMALHYLDTLISITEESETRLGTLFREKGDIYDELGDFQRALENYQNAERIQKQQNRTRSLVTTYINISGTYTNLNDSLYLKAFLQNQKKLEALEDVHISEEQKAMLLMNEGSMYNIKSDYNEAFSSYQRALDFAIQTEHDEVIFGILNNLGVICIKQSKFKEAKAFFDSSLEFVNNSSMRLASVMDNLGDLDMAQKEHDSAVLQYKKAISVLLYGDYTSYLTNLPSFEEITVSPYKKDILAYLIDESEAWYKLDKTEYRSNRFEEADKIIDLVDLLIDDLYFESREDLSKLFWREKGANLYVMAVAICYELNDPKKALYYMEKNKGMMLLENISESKAKRLAGIPSEIVKQERSILKGIKQLQGTLSSINSISVSSVEIDSLKRTIFNEKRKYRHFIDSLEYAFPKYYNYKNKVAIVTRGDIDRIKGENETIVSYIMGDNEGFVALLANNKVTLKKFANLPDLKEKLAIFHRLVKTPFDSQDARGEYKIIAYELFQTLFPFPEFQNDILPKKVDIIPDGLLYALPFEALIANPDGSLEETYLISHSEVLYQYSLSVNSQMENISDANSNGFVGFIPIQYYQNYVSTLNNGPSEIAILEENLKGEFFTHEEATKAIFLDKYQTNNVVHLSTHGGVDAAGPWLAFYDQKLSLDELYFTASKKELVVLSACKTTVGSQARGEGVINFTRGFINAGARSVVTSLWDINEKSSAAVITNFYKNLVDGNTKASSLRKSKLAYLDAHLNTSEVSPSYWSGIVITGQNAPLLTSGNEQAGWWMLLLLVGALFGYWFLQKK